MVLTLVAARGPAARWALRQGVAAQEARDLERAERLLSWAVRLAPAATAPRLERALCRQLRGDYRAAERDLDPLRRRPPAARRERARLRNAEGVNLFNFHRPEAALGLHTESLELAETLGDERLAAQALIDRSRVLYHSLGETAAAEADLERALGLARRRGDVRLQADVLRNQAVVLFWRRDEWQRAGELLEDAVRLYEQARDPRGAAFGRANLAIVRYFQGDLLAARQLQQRSIASRRRVGDLGGLAESYAFLTGLYLEIGQHGQAAEMNARGREWTRRLGYRLLEIEMESATADLHARRGDYDRAIAELEALLRREDEAPAMRKYRVGNLGAYHLRKGEPAIARRHLEEALRLESLAPEARLRAGLLLNVAATYVAEGNLDSAEVTLAEADALTLADSEEAWFGVLYLLRLRADIHERRGRRAEAVAELRAASEIEARTLGATGSELLHGGRQDLYDDLLGLLLAGEPASADEALEVLELMRYRSLRRLITRVGRPASGEEAAARRAEGAAAARVLSAARGRDGEASLATLRRAYAAYEEHALRAELGASQRALLRESRPASAAEIRAALRPEEALVVYVCLGEETHALVARAQGVEAFRLALSPSALAAKVKLLRRLLADPGEGGDWRPVAIDLRARLIEPLERSGALAGARRLGLVPYGPLHDLPFAALRRPGRSGSALVDDYELFHLPAASFLVQARRRPAGGAPRRAAAFGRNAAGPEHPPLAAAEAEAAEVAALLGGELRCGRQASETELKSWAPRCEILHLATHGVSEPHMPLLSRLELAPSAEDDGRLTVREVLELDLHARLVTLSACRTALGFSRGPDLGEIDRVGLGEAFLRAGARAVLASLLEVDDASATGLLRDFYAGLGGGKAAALAAAQRRLSRSGRHPRHWAPFLLLGDPD